MLGTIATTGTLDRGAGGDCSLANPRHTSLDQDRTDFCGLLMLTQDGLRESGNFLTMAVMLIQSGQSARLLDASIHLTGILALVKLALGFY